MVTSPEELVIGLAQMPILDLIMDTKRYGEHSIRVLSEYEDCSGQGCHGLVT